MLRELKQVVESALSESINDKILFKAVLFSGGSGVGKSFINDLMFSGLPVMVVDSDAVFVRRLRKFNLPEKIAPEGTEMNDEQMRHRSRAKDVVNNRLEQWVNGMLPLIIDGTGKKYKKIVEQKKALEDVGYDTSMVFVNTSLEVALKANRERERSVTDQVATESWHETQQNLGKFQDLFGAGNMLIVDNTKRVSGDELGKLKTKLFKAGMKFINSPLKNPKGKRILRELTERGKLYLSDLMAYKSVEI